MFVLMLLKMKQPDCGGQSHEWIVTLLAELICCWFCHFKNTESSVQGKHLKYERQNLDLSCHLKQLCWVVCCSHYLYLVIQGVSVDRSCTSLFLLENRFVLWKLKNVRKERRKWRKKEKQTCNLLELGGWGEDLQFCQSFYWHECLEREKKRKTQNQPLPSSLNFEAK